MSSSPSTNSQYRNDIVDTEIQKSTFLYLCDQEFIWKGDLNASKQFVTADLKLNGKCLSPGGETKQISSPDFGLKWYGPTKKRVVVVKDKERYLKIALKNYAHTIDGDNEQETCENKTSKHVGHILAEDNIHDSNSEHSTCEHCESYKLEIAKIMALVTKIQKKQSEEDQNTITRAEESDAKIKTLAEDNNKMAAELESLKANVEELAGENESIMSILELKQNDWIKVETTKKVASANKPEIR